VPREPEALAFLSQENTCPHPTPEGNYKHILPLSRVTNQQEASELQGGHMLKRRQSGSPVNLVSA
jgi:hypothetical protein